MNAPQQPYGISRGAYRLYTSMLPSEQRLRANRDFRFVYARGRSYPHPLVVLHVLRRSGDYANLAPGRRIGFVVSKKQGGAVVRNRIKRRLREAVRLRLSDMKQGPFDMILVARSAARTAEWREIQAAIDDLFRRANLLRSGQEPNEREPSDANMESRVESPNVGRLSTES